MATKDKKERYISRSLLKGLEILKMFNEETPNLSLAEIAEKLGVSRTTPYRLLYTLQEAGFLHQDENTKRYELTPKVLQLGFSYLNALQLPEMAAPYLEKLRDETNASAHLGILDGREVVYVSRVPARGVTTVHVNVGSRLPAYATAIGKVLLAYQPVEKLKGIIYGTELHTYTEYTKTDLYVLQKELDQIREKGYAISNEEFEEGICSVAAPIFNRQKQVIAAINLATPAYQVKKDKLEQVFLPLIQEVARKLSVYSGYRF